MEGKKHRLVIDPLLPERIRRKSGSNNIFSAFTYNKLRRFRKFSVGLFLLLFVILVYTILIPSSPPPESILGEQILEGKSDPKLVPTFVRSHIEVNSADFIVPNIMSMTTSSGISQDSPLSSANPGLINTKENDQHVNPDPIPQLHDFPRERGMTCRLPNLNAFDESVMKFLTESEIIECENKDYPLLFTLDLNSTLISLKNPLEFGYEQCCFFDLTRKSKDDDEVIIAEECTPITENITEIPLGQENIVISCKDVNNNLWTDIDIMGIPRLIPQLEDYLQEKREEREKIQLNLEQDLKENYNVIILGLDAVSHMNFKRTMPLTFDYIVNSLSAVYFDGYMKVGENTFPNAMATLTGHSVEELKDICWSSDEDFLDACPFIWKNYSEDGFYRTSYGEDAPLIGTFNYLKKGFNSPPVDYYLRPLMLSQDLYIGHENILNANVCYGPRLAFEVLLSYMKNFAFVMNHTKTYFQYIWANSIFHDIISGPTLGDKALADTLTWFSEEGYLNDTILVIQSDHGMRWGDLRETFQGRIEERMPLLYIIFPPKFQNKYKRAINNIKNNQKRLTTHFDLHETLLDILHLNSKLSEEALEMREKDLLNQLQNKSRVPRGISLFLPVPKSRTCEMAQVHQHFCVCSSLRPINIKNNNQVEEGAAQIVTEINKKLNDYKDCAQLTLSEIISAHILVQDGSMDDLETTEMSSKQNEDLSVTSKTTFEITIKTFPGLALFEASISRFLNGTFVVENISRANLYGRQSKCVTESSLKMFCYCVN